MNSFTGEFLSIVDEMMDENSPNYDPTFPKKVTISQKRIAWSAWEIHQWIEAKLLIVNKRAFTYCFLINLFLIKRQIRVHSQIQENQSAIIVRFIQ